MSDNNNVWNYCTNSAIRRASRQLGKLYDGVFASNGLKLTQFSLITQILQSDSPTLKNLAEALVMDLSALGHTLKPLIRDGLVELTPDDRDKRVKRVRLTPMGVAKQAEMLPQWIEATRRFDRAFGAEQSAKIREAINFLSSAEFARDFLHDEPDVTDR